ncbi:hypothetical protein GCM10007423_23400 [Dyadobacter endophyticus]|uniref:Probable inorganic carbon transporter subunit DabA n=1 Tax=Dyadobacter endophyticus TaxID=1749036 RepID=A0ABQ1YQL4_9BACT|nr:DUF2309 domain-containing protein [Dyadobacter endophyticus]GGH33262.1 hypothetical protein GCM10007423_23400 [Dyadobacter endophyticus]
MNASINDSPAQNGLYNEQKTLELLRRFLPSQPPLKDFIHHNPLHGFQRLKFEDGLACASKIFGYQLYLPLEEYRSLYGSGRISRTALEQAVLEKHPDKGFESWQDRLFSKQYKAHKHARIGSLRSNWKRLYKIDLDSQTHPVLFRILSGYLDQGIATWQFPVDPAGFIGSVRKMEQNGLVSFFHSKRASRLLLDTSCEITDLLETLVGRPALYSQYLFDQQFAHPGWSGMASWVENNPGSLSLERKISLRELIQFELLLEIDALDSRFGYAWLPLGRRVGAVSGDIFAPAEKTEQEQVLAIWQNAFEWSYYDHVLLMLSRQKGKNEQYHNRSSQSLFCLDDRSGSLRRHLEQADPACETFGTPGFFGASFFFQAQPNGSYTKQAPVQSKPTHLIKQIGASQTHRSSLDLPLGSNSLFRGWLISQTLGFWATFKLLLNVFRPQSSLLAPEAAKEHENAPWLSIENSASYQLEKGLQVGYTVREMADCVESVLRSIDLTADFTRVVYVIGHGASSVNNPHYAAYDCGACSGNPGGINARVLAWMANHQKVRELLDEKGVRIPGHTQFVGAFHDTTRDDITFYDTQMLSKENRLHHDANHKVFVKALDLNAKERAGRFASVDPKLTPEKAHQAVRSRSVSLFEPRPELNHATNAVCIVGHRNLSRGLFWDRRLFMNSYNYASDPDGKALFDILSAATPVCAGINLEYFFSRTDNLRLGAGSKLPHNVMGLLGVANGMEGDLRTGLPCQMTELHDPVRLLMIVEHFPHVVSMVIGRSEKLREWFVNQWVHLVVVEPGSRTFLRFKDDRFVAYHPSAYDEKAAENLWPVHGQRMDNLSKHTLPVQP